MRFRERGKRYGDDQGDENLLETLEGGIESARKMFQKGWECTDLNLKDYSWGVDAVAVFRLAKTKSPNHAEWASKVRLLESRLNQCRWGLHPARGNQRGPLSQVLKYPGGSQLIGLITKPQIRLRRPLLQGRGGCQAENSLRNTKTTQRCLKFKDSQVVSDPQWLEDEWTRLNKKRLKEGQCLHWTATGCKFASLEAQYQQTRTTCLK